MVLLRSHLFFVHLANELDQFLPHGQLDSAGRQLVCGHFLCHCLNEAVIDDLLLYSLSLFLNEFLRFHFVEKLGDLAISLLVLVCAKIDFDVPTLVVFRITVVVHRTKCSTRWAKAIWQVFVVLVQLIILYFSNKFVFGLDSVQSVVDIINVHLLSSRSLLFVLLPASLRWSFDIFIAQLDHLVFLRLLEVDLLLLLSLPSRVVEGIFADMILNVRLVVSRKARAIRRVFLLAAYLFLHFIDLLFQSETLIVIVFLLLALPLFLGLIGIAVDGLGEPRRLRVQARRALFIVILSFLRPHFPLESLDLKSFSILVLSIRAHGLDHTRLHLRAERRLHVRIVLR